jgi:hypothetical protein
MNTYTETFQKYERESARGARSSKSKCADHYDTGGKDKKRGYSSQRSLKRNWEQEV